MNEIMKLKAFDKLTKKIEKVMSIDFVSKTVVIEHDMEIKNDFFHEDGVCILGWVRNFDDVILLPFTGFTDKNDEEIYEGNIVSQPGYTKPFNQKITYECGYFIKFLTGGEQDEFGTLEEYCNYVEVVGNIYQNPELLKN